MNIEPAKDLHPCDESLASSLPEFRALFSENVYLQPAGQEGHRLPTGGVFASGCVSSSVLFQEHDVSRERQASDR
ncbi:MAG: hypothetical protein WBW16_03000 [Bacteroidota bacterium]